MNEDLTLNGFRKSDDVLLERGGTAKEITRVRFFLGNHGPFDRTFDRGVADDKIQQAIRDEKRSIETLTRGV